MPSQSSISLPDGRTWYVGSNCVVGRQGTSAQVIVPTERLEGLSYEDIGRFVTALVPQAKLLAAEEKADWWQYNKEGACHIDCIDELQEILDYIEPFAPKSQFIQVSVEEIKTVLAFLRLQNQGLKLARIPQPSLRRQVIARDGNFCRYCGSIIAQKGIQIDHVIPYSKGGLTELNNLVVSCRSCNAKKHNKLPEDAGMSLLPIPIS